MLCPQRGEAKLQEVLPNLRQERVRIDDDSPPEGWHALAETPLALWWCVNDGLHVHDR